MKEDTYSYFLMKISLANQLHRLSKQHIVLRLLICTRRLTIIYFFGVLLVVIFIICLSFLFRILEDNMINKVHQNGFRGLQNVTWM